MGACPFRPFGGTCPFSSHRASRFREPPYDPGRSDFPSPVLTLACPPTAFPQRRRLKCWHTYTPLRRGLHVGLDPAFMARLLPALRPGPPQGPPGAQRSFARSRCYLSRGGVSHHLKGHYPFFIAHMTSCDRPKPSHRLRSLPWSAGPCRLLPAPAGRWPFPTLSPHVFPWMLGPLSRRFVRCSYPFLPPQHRPSPSYHGSALPRLPTQTTSEWKELSRLQPFRYVRASKFARHPGRSHLCGFSPQGGHGFYVRAEHTSLPTDASDMLALRTGQLRARGLSPRKTRGLVGRSDRKFLSQISTIARE